MLPLHMGRALPSTRHRTWCSGSVPPWVQTGTGAAVLGRCLIMLHSSQGQSEGSRGRDASAVPGRQRLDRNELPGQAGKPKRCVIPSGWKFGLEPKGCPIPARVQEFTPTSPGFAHP